MHSRHPSLNVESTGKADLIIPPQHIIITSTILDVRVCRRGSIAAEKAWTTHLCRASQKHEFASKIPLLSCIFVIFNEDESTSIFRVGADNDIHTHTYVRHYYNIVPLSSYICPLFFTQAWSTKRGNSQVCSWKKKTERPSCGEQSSCNFRQGRFFRVRGVFARQCARPVDRGGRP